MSTGPSAGYAGTARSAELHAAARRFLPAGVTGDGRYFAPYPIAFASAHGNYLRDVDGNEYLDYHGGFGTAVLGYSHPEVDQAVAQATSDVGTFVGLSHPYEQALAERLCGILPLADRVALCGGGGSDAVYHAVRLARAATGRTKLVKIEGGYQGWHADVGVSTRPQLGDMSKVRSPQGVPNSPGSLAAVSAEVFVAPENDREALEQLFAQHGRDIAGLIMEPVLYSSGCVLVDREYLQLARELCTASGAVLIFDEVMSGFRAGLAGAGARLGVTADLGCFGKAVANGYILAILAGREELMRRLTPEGDVFYSGTFNGHPLSVAAAMATLDVLERDGVLPKIDALGERLAAGVNAAIAELGLRAVCQTFGSVWNVYFNTTGVHDYRDLAASSGPATARLNAAYLTYLRERGIYVHTRHVNRAFISAQHDEADIDRTIAVIRGFLEEHASEPST
jgi:glutamate-1-semialdehyde 2,1-aminomutase